MNPYLINGKTELVLLIDTVKQTVYEGVLEVHSYVYVDVFTITN